MPASWETFPPPPPASSRSLARSTDDGRMNRDDHDAASGRRPSHGSSQQRPEPHGHHGHHHHGPHHGSPHHPAHGSAPAATQAVPPSHRGPRSPTAGYGSGPLPPPRGHYAGSLPPSPPSAPSGANSGSGSYGYGGPPPPPPHARDESMSSRDRWRAPQPMPSPRSDPMSMSSILGPSSRAMQESPESRAPLSRVERERERERDWERERERERDRDRDRSRSVYPPGQPSTLSRGDRRSPPPAAMTAPGTAASSPSTQLPPRQKWSDSAGDGYMPPSSWREREREREIELEREREREHNWRAPPRRPPPHALPGPERGPAPHQPTHTRVPSGDLRYHGPPPPGAGAGPGPREMGSNALPLRESPVMGPHRSRHSREPSGGELPIAPPGRDRGQAPYMGHFDDPRGPPGPGGDGPLPPPHLHAMLPPNRSPDRSRPVGGYGMYDDDERERRERDYRRRDRERERDRGIRERERAPEMIVDRYGRPIPPPDAMMDDGPFDRYGPPSHPQPPVSPPTAAGRGPPPPPPPGAAGGPPPRSHYDGRGPMPSGAPDYRPVSPVQGRPSGDRRKEKTKGQAAASARDKPPSAYGPPQPSLPSVPPSAPAGKYGPIVGRDGIPEYERPPRAGPPSAAAGPPVAAYGQPQPKHEPGLPPPHAPPPFTSPSAAERKRLSADGLGPSLPQTGAVGKSQSQAASAASFAAEREQGEREQREATERENKLHRDREREQEKRERRKERQQAEKQQALEKEREREQRERERAIDMERAHAHAHAQAQAQAQAQAAQMAGGAIGDLPYTARPPPGSLEDAMMAAARDQAFIAAHQQAFGRPPTVAEIQAAVQQAAIAGYPPGVVLPPGVNPATAFGMPPQAAPQPHVPRDPNAGPRVDSEPVWVYLELCERDEAIRRLQRLPLDSTNEPDMAVVAGPEGPQLVERLSGDSTTAATAKAQPPPAAQKTVETAAKDGELTEVDRQAKTPEAQPLPVVETPVDPLPRHLVGMDKGRPVRHLGSWLYDPTIDPLFPAELLAKNVGATIEVRVPGDLLSQQRKGGPSWDDFVQLERQALDRREMGEPLQALIEGEAGRLALEGRGNGWKLGWRGKEHARMSFEMRIEERIAEAALFREKPQRSAPAPTANGYKGKTASKEASSANNADLASPWRFWRQTPLLRRKLWGTDVYTDDSDILAMCVHAGWVEGPSLEPEGVPAWVPPGRAARAWNGLSLSNAAAKATTGANGKAADANGAQEPPNAPADLSVILRIAPKLIAYKGCQRGGIKSRSWGNTHDGVSLVVESVELKQPGFATGPSRRQTKARINQSARFKMQLLIDSPGLQDAATAERIKEALLEHSDDIASLGLVKLSDVAEALSAKRKHGGGADATTEEGDDDAATTAEKRIKMREDGGVKWFWTAPSRASTKAAEAAV